MTKRLKQQDDLISFDIRINGSKIPDMAEVVSIQVEIEVNRIASATVVIEDGGSIGAVNEPFDHSEGKLFIPGNDIEIQLGYGTKREKVFEGMIVSHRLEVRQNRSQLSILCKHKAVVMTHGRSNATFLNKKDSEAIRSIAKNSGVSVKIDSTAQTLPILTQYNCTDWDFVVIRSELNNRMVLTDTGELRIKKYDFGASPAVEINAQDTIIDVDLKLDGEEIAGDFQLTAWDENEQKEVQVSKKISDTLAQGNISAKKLSSGLKNGVSKHYTSASVSRDELESWGEILSTKAVLSKITGTLVVPGTPNLTAGDLIRISAFSKRFNGKAFVSGVSHEVSEGTWITTLYIGKNTDWQSALPDVPDIPASGLIPAIQGQQIGLVKKIHEDPEGNYRVLVTLPSFSGQGQDEGIWARLSIPYASADAGFFFFPEIGDEVLLSFINNDPRFGVITGSLYSAKNKPKEVPDEKNQFKSLYSKSGIKIRFDDVDKILEMETPSGNLISMDDKNKSLSIKDESGNSMKMDESGITIESSKDLKLTAKGNIEISANSAITQKANADIKAEGMNLNFTAKTGFTAKGNATAEVSASGQTTIKGAMVMIN